MADMDGPIRRALISVYDKTGVAEFARALSELGVEIISSGGTAKTIAAAGVPVRELKEWTGFPEMLGHRVVTLHPKVHGGILALRDDPSHQADMKKYGIDPIDLVCVSLYPFEQIIAKEGTTLAEAIEMIDIGGPTMVRAAAKNHRYVTVVTGRDQYTSVLDDMKANDGRVSPDMRARLALAAFSLTAHYDAAISGYLSQIHGETFPDRLALTFRTAFARPAGAIPTSSPGPCVARAACRWSARRVRRTSARAASGTLRRGTAARRR
jgi:phosphoribosylaminoimidazolecarboxamide formyltransferase/IMP cyclohydrolase